MVRWKRAHALQRGRDRRAEPLGQQRDLAAWRRRRPSRRRSWATWRCASRFRGGGNVLHRAARRGAADLAGACNGGALVARQQLQVARESRRTPDRVRRWSRHAPLRRSSAITSACLSTSQVPLVIGFSSACWSMSCSWYLRPVSRRMPPAITSIGMPSRKASPMPLAACVTPAAGTMTSVPRLVPAATHGVSHERARRLRASPAPA